MTITHQIVDKKTDPSNGGSDIAGGGADIGSQLSGMIGQVSALAGAGVGLPGLNAIGSQISSLASSITGTGSSIASQISALGTQMATGAMAGMSGLASQMSGLVSQLSSLLNPSGTLAQVLHTHVLDKVKGIKASAFQGQHTTTWDQNGVTHTSNSAVTSTAPNIPHNGRTTVSDTLSVTKGIFGSDTLQVTKGVFGSSFAMLSDQRLKTRINDHPSVLEPVMALRLKTFDVHTVDWELGKVHASEARPSLGLIAQEVQQIFPDLVHGDKFLSIEESKIGLLLLAAFQEFVTETRKEIAELKRS